MFEERSSSSGSRRGGGGAGISPEPQTNVEVKELCQVFVTSGKAVKFDFTKNTTAIVNLNFNSKKTVGKTTAIVEMLKNKSTLTPETPEGEVYNYLNIWVGNRGFTTSTNIESAAVCFKVEKSWIQDKEIDKSSIILNRYSNKTWNQLPTSLSSEDADYIYFTAETPEFSPFAITGKTTVSGTGIQPQFVNDTLTNQHGSTSANAEQITGQKQNLNTSEKRNTSIPGFETVCGIVSLLVLFLYNRN